jgi:hypothetical protein
MATEYEGTHREEVVKKQMLAKTCDRGAYVEEAILTFTVHDSSTRRFRLFKSRWMMRGSEE